MSASSRRTPSLACATVQYVPNTTGRVSEVNGYRHDVARSGGVGRGRFVYPATHDYHLQAVAGKRDGSHGAPAVHGSRGDHTSGFGIDANTNAVLRQTGSEAECDARANLSAVLRLADEEDLGTDLSGHLSEGGDLGIDFRAVERGVLNGVDGGCAECDSLARRVFKVSAQEGDAYVVGDLPTRRDQLSRYGVEGLAFGEFA